MNKKLKKGFFIIKVIIPVAYIAIGLTIIFAPGAGVEKFLSPTMAPILGILLIAYGIFRGYRAYVSEKRDQSGN